MWSAPRCLGELSEDRAGNCCTSTWENNVFSFLYIFFKTKECAKAGTEDVKRGLKMLIIEGKGCFVEGIFNLPTV